MELSSNLKKYQDYINEDEIRAYLNQYLQPAQPKKQVQDFLSPIYSQGSFENIINSSLLILACSKN